MSTEETTTTQKIFFTSTPAIKNSLFFKPLSVTQNHKLDMIRAITSACSNVHVRPNDISDTISKEDGDLTIYIRTYFTYTYYLGLSPFRFSRDSAGNYIIKRWKPQQIFCALMNILSITRLVTEIRLGIRDLQMKDKATPVEYFENVMNIFSLAYKSATMRSFWCNQHKFLRILNNARKNAEKFVGYRPMIVNPWIVHGIFALFTFECFMDLAAGKNFIIDISKWTPSLWITRMVELARYTFFLDQNFHGNNNFTSVVSLEDGFLAAFMSLGMFQRYVLGFFCDLCIFSCSVSLWAHANVFAHTIKHSGVSCHRTGRTFHLSSSLRKEGDDDSKDDSDDGAMKPWPMVYQNFLIIQKISQSINQAISTQATLYIAESVMYYSLNLNAVMTIKNFLRRVDMVYFYFLTFGTFIFAADVGNQMECLKRWIFYGRNRFKIPVEEMSLILHEMLAKDVGIRGSDVFTISYSFLACLLSTTVTIFIISVQDSDDRNGTDDSYLSFVSSKRN